MSTAAPLTPPREFRLAQGLTIFWFIVLGVAPESDRLTWFLENAPVLIVVPILIATYGRFPLTRLLYWLIVVHAVILMVGGHWTYAEVPAGHWVSEQLGWERNHYDRLGHIAQGFIPAIAAREILLRLTPLERGRWLFFIVTSMCLGFSAFYELIEWWAAVLTEEGATAFLGTQGDVWDTQWDMFLCLCGAIASQVLLGGVHDRQLEGVA